MSIPVPTPMLLLGLHADWSAALTPLAPRQVPIPDDLSRALGGGGRTRLRASRFLVGPHKAPLGDCRLVEIEGAASEILNAWIFPCSGVSLPTFAAEVLVFGRIPRLVFIDLQTAGLPSVRQAEVREQTQAIRSRIDLRSPEEPAPDWAVHAASGGELYSRLGETSHTEQVRTAFRAYLELWCAFARAEPKPLSSEDAAAADRTLRQYKQLHANHSPGRAFLSKLFSATWTDRFFAEFLYA